MRVDPVARQRYSDKVNNQQLISRMEGLASNPNQPEVVDSLKSVESISSSQLKILQNIEDSLSDRDKNAMFLAMFSHMETLMTVVEELATELKEVKKMASTFQDPQDISSLATSLKEIKDLLDSLVEEDK